MKEMRMLLEELEEIKQKHKENAMNSIKFKCSDNALWMLMQMLQQIESMSEQKVTRRIRIGGPVYVFNGDGPDMIDEVYINDEPLEDAIECPHIKALRTFTQPIPTSSDTTSVVDATASDNTTPNGDGTMDGTSTAPTGSLLLDGDGDGTDGTDGTDSNDGNDSDSVVDSTVSPSSLSSSEKDEVEHIVADWNGAQKMYTAFDVTKQMRSAGHRVKHAHVKDHVHFLYDNDLMDGLVCRELIQIHGVSIDPWLYLAQSADSTMYDPTGASNNVPV